jgi:aspartyl protease family protein
MPAFGLRNRTGLMRQLLRSISILAAFSICGAAQAAGVYVLSLGYDQAQVKINGAERSMWVGDTSPEGVRLVSLGQDGALFDVEGKLWVLKAGQGTFSQAVLKADDHGQFFLTVQVNGAALPAIIDTGATSVAMNSEDAYRLGIDYLRGERVTARTASGPSTAYLVTLSSVQVGEIVLNNVQASIIEVSKDELPLVLVGMSFLKKVDMRRSGDTMQLQKRDF